MVKRTPIGKKTRFEVFKRDGFICQYCGNTPPKVVLEADHIVPVSKGGTNDMTNLATACFTCNRGKRDIELSVIPESLYSKSEELKEREDQLVEYRKVLDRIARREKKERKKVNDAYEDCYPDYYLKAKFLNTSVKKFIEELGVEEVVDSMYKAATKIADPEKAIKYFCGICWNKIREADES